MNKKEEVMKWWISGFNGKDPRGESDLFSFYSYKENKWINIIKMII